MKILFAIQGTGNGHLSRARDIYPELKKYGQVDILVSGYQADVSLPYPVKYRMKGLSFIFGRHGGVSLWHTLRKLRPFRFFKDVYHLPVEDYDLVVNDFEPVSAWACRLHKVPCLALSHQSAVIQPAAPKPAGGRAGRFILKYYAPFTDYYGFHFQSYDRKTFTPVIRREVQALKSSNKGHYTVYLPAYDDVTLIRFLHRFREVQWQVFSKHNNEAFTFENIHIAPIENAAFMTSLASCAGALMGAGFEGPAEALYLGKKLMVAPMKRQFEQQCNAAALASMGVPVIPALSSRTFRRVHEWLKDDTVVPLNFPRETASVAVGRLMEDFIARAARLHPTFPKLS